MHAAINCPISNETWSKSTEAQPNVQSMKKGCTKTDNCIVVECTVWRFIFFMILPRRAIVHNAQHSKLDRVR